MKSKLINVGYLIIGIVLAVVVMNLVSDKESKSIHEGSVMVTPPNQPESLAPQTSPRKSNSEKLDSMSDDPVESEETAVPSEADQIRDLMGKVFSGKATEEEALAFWEQMRTSDEINRIIAEQERNTPLESDDIRGHMNLADLYVAKILAAASGPEKGLWGNKALKRWQAVLEMDPNHWDARYSLAFSMSQYPDFMNMTGEAIAEYEKVVILQRDMDPEPRQVNTYLELFRLYQKRGDQANAFDAITEGLERFPDNKQLLEQKNSVSTLQ